MTAADSGRAPGAGQLDSQPAEASCTGGCASAPEDAIVRRTKDGWRVGADELPDLASAMILADLLAAEQDGQNGYPAHKPTPEQQAGEARRRRR